MHRNRSVNVHQFSMVPRADIPRSGFRIESAYKTTFDSGYLVPIYCEEVLPGDTFNLRATMFARLATPIVPIIDNLYLESFFFFVPNRLTWNNWQKFCGEQENPGDSIDYTIPQVVSAAGGFVAGSVFDYLGLPTAGQITAPNTVTANALPFRGYNLIWNEWFRDENLQTRAIVNKTDASEAVAAFPLRRRGKRHDYFTSCLPWTQKGAPVTLPLGGQAVVKADVNNLVTGAQNPMRYLYSPAGGAVANVAIASVGGYAQSSNNAIASDPTQRMYPSNLYADLSTATAATINQIRQAFQIQRLLERDARGGTRYTELLKSHFGVTSADARLQRPEYLGGGLTAVNIQSVTQTSGSPGSGGYTDTPLGALSAVGTALAHGHGFTHSFTEHGYVIGMIAVRADLNYQQGLNRMWSRKTRYDFYWPVFAMLGEQAVLNKEIYCKGTQDANDELVFGYQERWAEYRYKPSLITGQLRSTFAQPLDIWHLAQNFTALPTLNDTFIQDNPPVDRVVATTEQTGQQFVLDCVFSNKAARALPMYSVPGLVDHF
ncbi:MAG: major capsid protein [Microviridae sp.]|nr:MAG: major capsid protein [Microviridae sp.]